MKGPDVCQDVRGGFHLDKHKWGCARSAELNACLVDLCQVYPSIMLVGIGVELQQRREGVPYQKPSFSLECNSHLWKSMIILVFQPPQATKIWLNPVEGWPNMAQPPRCTRTGSTFATRGVTDEDLEEQVLQTARPKDGWSWGSLDGWSWGTDKDGAMSCNFWHGSRWSSDILTYSSQHSLLFFSP